MGLPRRSAEHRPGLVHKQNSQQIPRSKIGSRENEIIAKLSRVFQSLAFSAYNYIRDLVALATIRVHDEFYRKLNRMAGQLQTELGRPVSMEEVLEGLLK